MNINMIYTAAGLALQAKMETGVSLNITRIAAGAGTSNDLINAVGVTDPRQELTITGTEQKGTQAYIFAILSNAGLLTGYDLTQIGIYADDPDDGEILYKIVQFERAYPISAEVDFPNLSIDCVFTDTVSNASTVNVIVDPSGVVTSGQFMGNLEKLYSHIGRLQSSGEWEPKLITGSDRTITYLTSEAKYQRTGNRVYVQAVINFITDKIGGSSQLLGLDIASLPFEIVEDFPQIPVTGNWRLMPISAIGGVGKIGSFDYKSTSAPYIPFSGLETTILDSGQETGAQWRIIFGFSYFTNDEDNISPEEAPSIMLQINNVLTSVSIAVASMKQMAANGEFDGKTGPQGVQGSPGSEPVLQSIVRLTDGNIPLTPDRTLYAHSPTGNTSYTFDVSGMGDLTDKCVTFELHIAMPDPHVVITFPGNMTWQDEPNTSDGNMTYVLVFRSMDGGVSWRGNQADKYAGG